MLTTVSSAFFSVFLQSKEGEDTTSTTGSKSWEPSSQSPTTRKLTPAVFSLLFYSRRPTVSTVLILQ